MERKKCVHICLNSLLTNKYFSRNNKNYELKRKMFFMLDLIISYGSERVYFYMFKLKKISGCLCIIRSPFLSYNLPSPRKRDPDIKFFLKIELCHGKTSVSDPYKYSFIRIKIQPFSFPRLKFKNIF